MRVVRRRALAVVLGVILLALPWAANAEGAFKKVATISATLGIGSDRVCVGAPTTGGPQGIIGCAATAPQIVAGGISASGIITATEFRGDVSGVNVHKGNETCSSIADHGKMVFGDAGIHACTPFGWRFMAYHTTIIDAAAAPSDQSWTGGYFVLVRSAASNSNFGGRAGAASICLNRLTRDPWKGKMDSYTRGMLNSSKIRPFLCDASTCENAVPNTSYRYAQAEMPSQGGASFTSDGNGAGPGDSSNWGAYGGTTKFHVDGEGNGSMYVTGRGAGTSTAWGTSPHSATCSGWTSTSGNNARVGYNNLTGTSRWSQASSACNFAVNLICFVDP